MSGIFNTETHTVMKPRHDATIRVAYWTMPPGTNMATDHKEYRRVKLLEFHPDYDTRLKFRGYARIALETWMEHPAYENRGKCPLPDGEVDYVEVREFMIHEDDRAELYRYCSQETPTHKRYAPLIIWPVQQRPNRYTAQQQESEG